MSVATSTAIGLGLGVAGIGSSVATGIIGSNAAHDATNAQVSMANRAADLQKQAADQSLAFQKLQYGNSLNLLSPFYNTGTAANSRLASLMGLRPNQGLPQGVINPNAPAAPPASRQILNGGMVDPDMLNSLRMLRGGGGGGVRMPMQATSMMNPQVGGGNGGNGTYSFPQQFNMRPPITSGGTQGTQFQMNPPITSGTNQGPNGVMNPNGGAAGMLQLGPDGKLTGTGPEFNPSPGGTLNLNPSANGPTPTAADGSPGTVPRTDGGGPTPAPGTPPDPSQLNTNGGTFGSLANGWGQTFKSPTNLTDDPGYNFRLSEGMKALQNSAAAKGGLLTGGTAKAVNDYAGGSASQEYGNTYNRALQNYNTNYNTFTNDQTNLFNRLASLSGQGQVSANNLSNAGVNAANTNANINLTSAGQIGQQYNNAGAANASGYINSANAINGAIGGVSNSLSTLAMLRMLQGGGTSPNPASGNGAF